MHHGSAINGEATVVQPLDEVDEVSVVRETGRRLLHEEKDLLRLRTQGSDPRLKTRGSVRHLDVFFFLIFFLKK